MWFLDIKTIKVISGLISENLVNSIVESAK